MTAWVECVLPKGPGRMFGLAEPILTAAFGQKGYRLGGGTALAAVWEHRHSTDVDLFADHAAYRAGVDSQERERWLKEELFKVLQPLGPEGIDVAHGFLKVVCREGELGLYTPPVPLDTFPAAKNKVAGTDIELESPAIILARKIHGRMLGSGVLTLRDLYAISAASVLAPEELTVALGSVREDDKEALRDELKSLPTDWVWNPEDSGRRLIEVRRPTKLATNPGICVGIVRALLADDWSWADQAQARSAASDDSVLRP